MLPQKKFKIRKFIKWMRDWNFVSKVDVQDSKYVIFISISQNFDFGENAKWWSGAC